VSKRKRRAWVSARPKGSYLLPTGGYLSTSSYHSPQRGRVLRIHAVHRAEPDARFVAQAVLDVVTRQMLERDQRAVTDPIDEREIGAQPRPCESRLGTPIFRNVYQMVLGSTPKCLPTRASDHPCS
jgi:hypothetical protein